ncbi:WD40 repeat-like protein [Choiromyces venosus 120613-1]|uniref:WD40 repeat-like protein n=1 Tax=Choiromyces venosus 120613-1 TaxID=1336337 RepID=A0A3N4K2Y8_9PEZI|nr:WD40 repeat-like protein [Choiromyces venosus 120613-1]
MMERRRLHRELNGARGIGSNASFYGARTWIERLDLIAELSGHEGCVNTLCWSRTGHLLASGSDDTQVNIHALYPDYTLNTRIDTGHTENIFSVKFMPGSSDRTILSAAGDGQVRIFDIEYAPRNSTAGSKSNRPVPSPSAPAIGQHFFFGRRMVVTGDGGGGGVTPLKEYSYSEHAHKVYRSHTARVKRIVTEDNPYTFLTCAEDGTVRQWDVRMPSEYYARPGSRRRARARGGMMVIDDWDDDSDDWSGSVSAGPPPLISYRKWGVELNAISCSTSRPYYIALGGRNLHCFLHDRRMTGRDLASERGSSSSPVSSSSSESTMRAMDTVTRCVRKFVPRPGGGSGWGAPHITSCKISDAYPDNLLVSWSGDGVYMFDINRSPDESGSGGGDGKKEKEKEAWDPDERRDKDASDPGPSSSRRRQSTAEPMSERPRESHDDSSSPSSSSEEGDDADSSEEDHHPVPREDQFLSTTGLLTSLQQKLTTLQTTPEAQADFSTSLLSTARQAYRRIRQRILTAEEHDLSSLTNPTLAENSSEFRRRRAERNARARERRKVRDWVRAVGYYARNVLLTGQQVGEGGREEDFEELEYTRDLKYRVFKLVCGILADGRDGGWEVIRGEDGGGFGFSQEGEEGEGEGEEEGEEARMLREYFTDLLINPDSRPILDGNGDAMYTSETELITTLRTIIAHQTIYLGHSNTLTIKDVTFIGQRDEYVVSGSDDGNFFIWDARSAQVVNILAADEEVVNVVVAHPHIPLLAVSGIGCRVGIFGVDGRLEGTGREGKRGRMGDLYAIVARNQGLNLGDHAGLGGREIVGGGGAVRAVCVPS